MKRWPSSARLFIPCLTIAVTSLQVASARADDVYAWIIGARTGWWAGGDTLLFEGDGEVSWPGCTAECPGDWCVTDYCFAFRKVSGVDLEACTWTDESDSHCAVVDGCFWMGSHYPFSQVCGECDWNHNYCGSIWRAMAFNAGPPGQGDVLPRFGCWSVKLLCMPEEPTDCTAEVPGDYCDE